MSKKSRRRKRLERQRLAQKTHRKTRKPVHDPLHYTCTADDWFRVADTLMRTDPPTVVTWTAYPAVGCKTPDAVSDFLRGNGFHVNKGWRTPLYPGVEFRLPPTPGS